MIQLWLEAIAATVGSDCWQRLVQWLLQWLSHCTQYFANGLDKWHTHLSSQLCSQAHAHFHTHISFHVSMHMPVHRSTRTCIDMSIQMFVRMSESVSVHIICTLFYKHIRTHGCTCLCADRRCGVPAARGPQNTSGGGTVPPLSTANGTGV